MTGIPVRKGRIDPMPYISKAKLARCSLRTLPFDVCRAFGGKRSSNTSAPLPLFLQPDRDKMVKQAKRGKRKMRALAELINPTPKFKVIGLIKYRI